MKKVRMVGVSIKYLGGGETNREIQLENNTVFYCSQK